MEKIKNRYIFLFIYELLRLVFVILIRPDEMVFVQGLSWYAGAALLVVPLVLCFFLYLNEQKYRLFLPLFGCIKILNIISFCGYCLVQFSYFFSVIAAGYYNSLRQLLVIFLIIVFDGIISGNCFSRNSHIINQTDPVSEGGECK